jgi:cyclin-dependent kinase 8/11
MLHNHWKQCSSKSEHGFALLRSMLEYDPERRISADQAMDHPYFQEDPRPSTKYVT